VGKNKGNFVPLKLKSTDLGWCDNSARGVSMLGVGNSGDAKSWSSWEGGRLGISSEILPQMSGAWSLFLLRVNRSQLALRLWELGALLVQSRESILDPPKIGPRLRWNPKRSATKSSLSIVGREGGSPQLYLRRPQCLPQ
jgi:hypothetical protein